MSEIRDRVREQIAGKPWRTLDGCEKHLAEESIDQILAIPELAIVDRDAGLPSRYQMFSNAEWAELEGNRLGTHIETTCAMKRLGYVKEVK